MFVKKFDILSIKETKSGIENYRTLALMKKKINLMGSSNKSRSIFFIKINLLIFLQDSYKYR